MISNWNVFPPEYKPEKYKSRNNAIPGRNTNTTIGTSNDHPGKQKDSHFHTRSI